MDEASGRFDEAMTIFRKSWAPKGRFSHHGRRWHSDSIVVEPAQFQQPHPPLWLAVPVQTASVAPRAKATPVARSVGRDRPDRTADRPCFRETREEAGRPFAPAKAFDARRRVPSIIGDLARDRLEDDTTTLLGTPGEIVVRLRELESVGTTNILLVDPNASAVNFRGGVAHQIMPAFPAPCDFAAG